MHEACRTESRKLGPCPGPGQWGNKSRHSTGKDPKDEAAARLLWDCCGMTKLGLDGGIKRWNESTLYRCVDLYTRILPYSFGFMSLCLPVLLVAVCVGCILRHQQ
jgi:hypothetical protein